jgi:hypothetical protein
MKKNGRGLLFNNKNWKLLITTVMMMMMKEKVPEQYIRSQIHFIIIALFTLQNSVLSTDMSKRIIF